MEESGMGVLPENLFEDEEVEISTETSQEENEGSPEQVQGSKEDTENDGNHVNEESIESSTLRVKYNGEERDLSLEEARTLAQKGLNYDHVVAERDQNRKAFDFLLERAKGEGITVEQLMEREGGKVENQRLEAKMSEIRARDDDASEDTIKSLAKFELEAEKAVVEKAKAEEDKKRQDAEREAWDRLFGAHPELISSDGGAKLTKSVFDLVRNEGFTPVEAYYIERNRELEAKNKILSDASEAKKKSVGSLTGIQNTEEDDFLAGFDAE
jgi:hypothetical protein